MQKPLVIIVSGLPGTGKTTLAKRVAADLNLPLVDKDGIKELLFDSLGWSDREWSRKLGITTYALIFYFVERLLAAGQSLIVESNFHREFGTANFLALGQKYDFEPFQVQCYAGGETIWERFKARAESGSRHPGHVEPESYAEMKPALLKGGYERLDLGGRLYELDTTDFEKVDYQKLLITLKEALNLNNKA